jgi:hypothetical protein
VNAKCLVIAVLVVVACSGGGEKARNDGAPGAWTASVLAIAPATLVIDDGRTRRQLRLAGDGAVFADDRHVASISITGELTMDGTLVAILLADGTVTIPNEGDETIKIRDDGALIDATDPKLVLLEFGADGVLRGPLARQMTMTSTGSPKARRALMLAWLGAMSILSVGDPTPPMD